MTVLPLPLPAPSPVTFWAGGKPITQGSMKTRRGRIVHDSGAVLMVWRERIGWAARIAHGSRALLAGPVLVELGVEVDRPRFHFRTGKNAHLLRDAAPVFPANRGSGDLDKHLRALLDALTGVVWVDDSQVVDVVARKRWAGVEGPGVRVTVSALVLPVVGAVAA